jgi:hypothetical protein
MKETLVHPVLIPFIFNFSRTVFSRKCHKTCVLKTAKIGKGNEWKLLNFA